MKTTHCPYCEAHAAAGAVLPETSERTGRLVSLDAGLTECVEGHLCAECDRAVGDELATERSET